MTEWQLKKSRTLLDAAEGTLRPGGVGLTTEALEVCRFAQGSRILDAGCGTGVTVRHLSSRENYKVFGIDRSPSLLAEACSQAHRPVLICGDLESLPFANQSFDGIICECTLSQTRVSAVLAQFGRVLRPGGALILTDLYRKRTPKSPLSGFKERDSLATKDQTIDLLKTAQFQTTHWQDRTGDLKQLAFRLIMAPGACLDNLFGWSRQSGDAQEQALRNDWQSLGYQLLIARRMTI
ncbi:class I SAM-dependent methyltransferase [Desulfocastanea catecholica]